VPCGVQNTSCTDAVDNILAVFLEEVSVHGSVKFG
jgi:hypothetical protein